MASYVLGPAARDSFNGRSRGDPLEQDAFGNDFISGPNGVIPRTANLPEAEVPELIFAQLKQADIRAGALIGVESWQLPS